MSNFLIGSKFITLTFKEGALNDLTDIRESNIYFKLFIQRLQYKYGNFKYVSVVQFQDSNGRGAVHYHLICDLPFIPQDELQRIWRGGSAHIKTVTSLDNRLINYMTKNFGDPRLVGKRSFLTSKNLDKPKVFYGEEAETISENYDLNKKESIYGNSYASEYNGQVQYYEYKLY